MAKYYSNAWEEYEFEIERCKGGFLVRVNGLPMATVDSRQEAEEEAERIVKDLLLTPFPTHLA